MKVTLTGTVDGVRGAAAKVAKGTVKYMHTLDNHPASYEGGQICWGYGPRNRAVKLVDSLAEIKANEKASIAWRKKRGLVDRERTDYSYIRVRI